MEKSAARLMDGVMCGMMNAVQGRRRDLVCTADGLDAYLNRCRPLSREDFYVVPEMAHLQRGSEKLEWESPVHSGFPTNDRARALLFCPHGASAPTVLLLHALMSASDGGYRKIAAGFNARGWNVVFPHLPYHYSRKPAGYFNGELTISADLIRNGETLRQGVTEIRQVMNLLRKGGTKEFGVIGTSYGGWTGALLSFLEPDLRFLALIQPIVNIDHAIWENPGSASMRRLLRKQGIVRGDVDQHSHLVSPLHGVPLCGGERAVITAGVYDSVARAEDLRRLHEAWAGSKYVPVRQGHFGYRAMQETLKEIEKFL